MKEEEGGRDEALQRIFLQTTRLCSHSSQFHVSRQAWQALKDGQGVSDCCTDNAPAQVFEVSARQLQTEAPPILGLVLLPGPVQHSV